jgi:hypothetical protein
VRDAIWAHKRAKLVAVNATLADGTLITVQRGNWYSAHEVWKLLEMPYLSGTVQCQTFESLIIPIAAVSCNQSIVSHLKTNKTTFESSIRDIFLTVLQEAILKSVFSTPIFISAFCYVRTLPTAVPIAQRVFRNGEVARARLMYAWLRRSQSMAP